MLLDLVQLCLTNFFDSKKNIFFSKLQKRVFDVDFVGFVRCCFIGELIDSELICKLKTTMFMSVY